MSNGHAEAPGLPFYFSASTSPERFCCLHGAAGLIDLTATHDVGMSIGGGGLISVTLAGWRHRWLWVTAILLVIACKLYIAPDLLADGGHIVALLLGFVLGILLARTDPARRP